MSISIVTLAYMEADNLEILIPRIISAVDSIHEDYEIIVVDTAEPMDGTADVCKKLGAKYINQRYPGFGGAYKTAIEFAENDKFLILDSDGQHDPKYIPDLVNKFNDGKYDVVIGSRYVDGGVNDEKLVSRISSWILNTSFRVCLGIKAHDLSTNFRIYDTAQLKRIDIHDKNLDVLQEILFKMKQNNPNFRIGEVPIVLQHRMYGETKRQTWRYIRSFAKSLFELTGIRITTAITNKGK